MSTARCPQLGQLANSLNLAQRTFERRHGWMDGTTRVCTPHSAAPLSAFLLGYGLGGLSSDLIARAESQSIHGFPLAFHTPRLLTS